MISSHPSYTLKRKMIIYFLLICVASMMVGAEFIADTHNKRLKEDLLKGYDRYATSQNKDEAVLFQPIEYLRNKAILMMMIILFVIIIVLTMFIRNITDPLQHMIEVADRISKGDLRKSVTIQSKNELSTLGNVINEMSANLQEMTLLSKQFCKAGRTLTGDLEYILKKREMSESDLDDAKIKVRMLQSELHTMQEMIDQFNFYTVGDSDDR